MYRTYPESAIMPGYYCDFATGDPWHGPYHDREYGFPIRDDRRLFERLMLEVNQAGLSWLTVLKKRASYKRLFDDFDAARIARYGARKKKALLKDEGIVRNRLKVEGDGRRTGSANQRSTLRRPG